MALLMIIITVASVSTSHWYLQNNLEATKNMLVSSIRKAQSYSMAKKNNLTWGVCLTGQNIRMFGGSCASPTINDDFIIPNNVSLSGLSTITFSSFRGEPSTAQSISISGNNKTYNLNLNLVGGLSVN